MFDPVEATKWLAEVFSTEEDRRFGHVVAGVNDDDCAVMRMGNELLVVSTDFVNANPIFMELKIGDYSTLGRLLVAVNVSDLCGSGVMPSGLVYSCTIPKDLELSDFKAIAVGVKQEAAKWGLPIVGGDTKIGSSMALCATIFGHVTSESRLFLKRDGKPGDSIWLSGELGAVNAAVLELKSTTDSVCTEWARKALCEPILPLGISQQLSKLEIANAGTDISDGLGMDLSQLCQASNVGATIYSDRIPLSSHVPRIAAKERLPSWAFAFGVGGDFQFLATVPEKFDNEMVNMGFVKIGSLTAAKDLILMVEGRAMPLPGGGHNDFQHTSFHDEIRTLLHSSVLQ